MPQEENAVSKIFSCIFIRYRFFFASIEVIITYLCIKTDGRLRVVYHASKSTSKHSQQHRKQKKKFTNTFSQWFSRDDAATAQSEASTPDIVFSGSQQNGHEESGAPNAIAPIAVIPQSEDIVNVRRHMNVILNPMARLNSSLIESNTAIDALFHNSEVTWGIYK